jgi:hypothetical protein
MKNMFKLLVFVTLSCALGVLFIFSGYTKLYPIEPFEMTFIDLGIANWKTAPFISRLLIGLEFFVGSLLFFNVYFNRKTLKLTIGILLLFSIYLLFILIKNGNNGNCGCFGNVIAMTPLQALMKNIFMLGIVFLLVRFYNGIDYRKATKYIAFSLVLLSFSFPHILNYVDLNYSSSYLTKKEYQFKLELDSLYKNASIHNPPKELKKGKQIIAFMSMTCGHCRIAAKKMRLLKRKSPNLPIYFVLNGESEKIKPFFDDTKAYNIKYCLLNGKSFIYLAGLEMPAIFLVNNSIVENRVSYFDLDQRQLELWIKK